MSSHTVTWNSDTACVTLTSIGDVGGSPTATIGFADGLDALIRTHTEHEPCVVAVDLTEVGFLDSSALNAMLAAHRRCGQRLLLRLTEAQAFLRRVLALSGLEDIFVIDTSTDTVAPPFAGSSESTMPLDYDPVDLRP